VLLLVGVVVTLLVLVVVLVLVLVPVLACVCVQVRVYACVRVRGAPHRLDVHFGIRPPRRPCPMSIWCLVCSCATGILRPHPLITGTPYVPGLTEARGKDSMRCYCPADDSISVELIQITLDIDVQHDALADNSSFLCSLHVGSSGVLVRFR